MLRRLALAAVLVGSTILLGCTHEQGGTAQLETTLPPGYGFHYLDEGGSAKLAFGQANSDNVGLMLQCAKGSRVVEVSDLVRSNSAPTMTLASGGQRSDMKVEVQPGPSSAIAVGRAPLGSPALAGFRKSGQIEVTYAGLHYAVAAKPQDRASLDRFFTACDRPA